jgi:hypothetical protein
LIHDLCVDAGAECPAASAKLAQNYRPRRRNLTVSEAGRMRKGG